VNFEGKIPVLGQLDAKIIRGGKVVEERQLASDLKPKLWVSVKRWARLLWKLKHDDRGLVTNAGVAYMAADFAANLSSPRISGFKYHDSGIGTAPEAVTDTGVGVPAGPARVAGTPSNPSANQYRTSATIFYAGILAITEWAVLSALTSGTLWDRRVFAVINVASTDGIQFIYTLTIPSGGT
jgi:hypothetical protein